LKNKNQQIKYREDLLAGPFQIISFKSCQLFLALLQMLFHISIPKAATEPLQLQQVTPLLEQLVALAQRSSELNEFCIESFDHGLHGTGGSTLSLYGKIWKAWRKYGKIKT
jgi:hypothetical protein